MARACQECAHNKVSRHTKPPVLQIDAQTGRFQQVHVDIVGPFPVGRDRKYILTMVDWTTRWPEAVPIREITAGTVLQAFLETWIARFRVPHIVTTDRGAQFTSQAWPDTLGKLGIKVSTTTAYHPQGNGLVEHFHRSLKSALRCGVSTTTSLPWVLLGLRNAPHTDTATSAGEIVYGTPLRVPGVCFMQEWAQNGDASRQLQLARNNVEQYMPPC